MEEEKGVTYTDNREIENRIFHLAKNFNVSLFEQDTVVEKIIQNLYRVCFCWRLSFLYLLLFRTLNSSCKRSQTMTNRCERSHRSTPYLPTFSKHITVWLINSPRSTICWCSESPFICSERPWLNLTANLCRVFITFALLESTFWALRFHTVLPISGTTSWLVTELLHSLSPVLATKSKASNCWKCYCPYFSILHHYKEQLQIVTNQRETLQTPTKTFSIPADVMTKIKTLSVWTLWLPAILPLSQCYILIVIALNVCHHSIFRVFCEKFKSPINVCMTQVNLYHSIRTLWLCSRYRLFDLGVGFKL